MNKEKTIWARIDIKLYKQLKRYADRNDESNVSLTARRALRKFIDEYNLKNKQNDR